MSAVVGRAGTGKTKAGLWLTNRTNAVCVRAYRLWSPTWMTIMQELGLAPMKRVATMMDRIIEELMISRRPLIIDEFDYVVENSRLLDTIRDIHDMATVPIIVLGEEKLPEKLRHRERFYGRVANWVRFGPASIRDARTLSDAVCEVGVEDDLISKLHAETAGSMRMMTTGLAAIERHGIQQGLKAVSLSDWGDRSSTPRQPKWRKM